MLARAAPELSLGRDNTKRAPDSSPRPAPVAYPMMLHVRCVLHVLRSSVQSSMVIIGMFGFGIGSLPRRSQLALKSEFFISAATFRPKPVPAARTAAPAVIQAAVRIREVGWSLDAATTA